MVSPYVPLLAGLVSTLFSALLLQRWSSRRGPHLLAWGVGFSFYALASFIESYVALSGWNVPLYRAYFPLASGTVGLLGLGTLLLLLQRSEKTSRLAPLYSSVLAGFLILVAALGPFLVPLSPKTPIPDSGGGVPFEKWGPELGAKAIPFPNPGRIAFLLLNVLGGTLLVAGALLAWWRSKAPGTLLIGVGALLPFLGGALSTLGILGERILLQFLGSLLMFGGFLVGEAKLGSPTTSAVPSHDPP